MLKLIEVFGTPEGEIGKPLLASLDVTQNTEGERQQVLTALRDLYGPDCKYFWHDCGHDDEKPCSSVEAS